MSHSFHAFIDEAGDEGFSFTEPPAKKGSSDWFNMSAVVIRGANLALAARRLHAVLDPIEERRKSPVHFRALPHESRVAIVKGIAKLPILTITVSFDKRRLADSTLVSKRRLHFYAARLVLERVSWIAKAKRRQGEGDGTCNLTFSRCKNLSYEALASYFSKLKEMDTQIKWAHLDTKKIKVGNHEDSIWLRAVDAVASGFYQAVELSNHGYCEDRYARDLKPIVYCRGTNYSGYGLKMMPGDPPVEVERDNRYQWLSLYRQKVG